LSIYHKIIGTIIIISFLRISIIYWSKKDI